MGLNKRLPFWLAIPLSLAAFHAIIVLGGLVLLVTPFAAVGYFTYQLVLMVDMPALQVFWDGEITTLLVLGSLQWLVIGVLIANVGRWIEALTKRVTRQTFAHGHAGRAGSEINVVRRAPVNALAVIQVRYTLLGRTMKTLGVFLIVIGIACFAMLCTGLVGWMAPIDTAALSSDSLVD